MPQYLAVKCFLMMEIITSTQGNPVSFQISKSISVRMCVCVSFCLCVCLSVRAFVCMGACECVWYRCVLIGQWSIQELSSSFLRQDLSLEPGSVISSALSQSGPNLAPRVLLSQSGPHLAPSVLLSQSGPKCPTVTAS